MYVYVFISLGYGSEDICGGMGATGVTKYLHIPHISFVVVDPVTFTVSSSSLLVVLLHHVYIYRYAAMVEHVCLNGDSEHVYVFPCL